jgi:cephalosporin hydroxylase
MKIEIDTETATITREGTAEPVQLYSKEGFELLSDLWVKVGWNQKYSYTFSWLGRPIIQMPEDMVRIQEVIYRLKPDVIIETGIAHGGSPLFYASVCHAMGRGRVIGVDIEIRPHNRAAIETHELASYVELIEGSSTDAATLGRVRSLVKRDESVLVILDSNHTRAHVLAELEAYAPLVTSGSYIVATDGIMKQLADVPRGDPAWATDNPTDAAEQYAAAHPDFVLEQPVWPFNESALTSNVTHWPGAWLRRA